jgi:hypothetical protein
MDKTATLIAASLLALACDQERTAADVRGARSTVVDGPARGGAGGAGGAGILDERGGGAPSGPAGADDVAEGPCPLGAHRACVAVTDDGCLEGRQYCVDGSWSFCVRDVEPRGR